MTVWSQKQEEPVPTQTFFNLPEAKRQAFIQAAIDEFANNDYANASITRIVARVGIAKGSVYQYFQDKRDLYLYLLDLATQEKLALLRNARPPDPGMSIFAYLRWLLHAGTQFQLAHPRLAQVAYRALYGDTPFHDETLARMKAAAYEYISQLVQQGLTQGDIDPDIDPELAVFVIHSLSVELGNFILKQQGIDPAALGQGNMHVFDTPEIARIFDQLAHILEHGLGHRRT